MLAYDITRDGITRDGITSQIWFFLLWVLFAAALFATSLRDVRRRVRPGRSGFVLAISTLFFIVAGTVLFLGVYHRQACLQTARSGDFDVTQGKVSEVRKLGRVAPFTYEFMIEDRKFTVESALVGSCGFAERPNFQMPLVEGAHLVIEHRGNEIYRVVSEP